MIEFIHAHYNYWVTIAIMMIGFYCVIAKTNLVKMVIGLGIFQTGIFLLFISIGRVDGGTAPVRVLGDNGEVVYSNPLPHALILTAIVVSVSVLAVALAIIVNVRERFGTVDEHDLAFLEAEQE